MWSKPEHEFHDNINVTHYLGRHSANFIQDMVGGLLLIQILWKSAKNLLFVVRQITLHWEGIRKVRMV